MQNFLLSILFGLSNLLGVAQLPSGSSFWQIEKSWQQAGNTWQFEASTNKVSELCANKDNYIIFPQVVHGVHKVWLDGKLFAQSGDDTFQKLSPFYGRASISCKFAQSAKLLTWEVVTYSKYFARINKFPIVSKSDSEDYFFDVVLNLISAGSLLILAMFSLFIFTGKVPFKYVLSLSVGAICYAIYSIMTSGTLVGISLSMIVAHRIADVSVWIGSFCYIYFFRKFNYLGKFEFFSFVASFFLAQTLIIFGGSPDIVQLGTTIPIPFAFICMASFLVYSIIDSKKNGFKKNHVLGMISVSLFVFSGMNDLLHIMGVIDSYMVMPIGSVFGVFFLAAAVNQDIEKTYIERDDLLKNLQFRVDEQTQHLSAALEQLRKSQAELVQSARLASLGTLSAGIAHEINNAINFVNGAIIPLERKVLKYVPEEESVIVNKLFDAIKQGTFLTVDIVRSLRNYTGLNQSKVKDVSVKSVVETILTILKSKLNSVRVIVDVPNDLTLSCYQVGINQIVMNLVSNALDVLPQENGCIEISAKDMGDGIELAIKDNGVGMSAETQSRIFDPFFTTKEVGKGTGLGLHIVLKEIEKHNGKIEVHSELGKGTKFLIYLPKSINYNISEAA